MPFRAEPQNLRRLWPANPAAFLTAENHFFK